MNCCGHCQDAGELFDQKVARREMRRYRSRGPSKNTRRLLDALLSQRRDDDTVLDIGAGVGAIPLELLGAGFSRAIQVDASPAYLEVSQHEAARRGFDDRITYRFGDFTDVASDVDLADVVTLDRVLCCYPDVDRLVAASASKARHLYGVVFPRERLVTRLGTTLGNLYFRLRGGAFRTYIHSRERVEDILRQAGFRRTSHAQSFLWQVATYERVEALH